MRSRNGGAAGSFVPHIAGRRNWVLASAWWFKNRVKLLLAVDRSSLAWRLTTCQLFPEARVPEQAEDEQEHPAPTAFSFLRVPPVCLRSQRVSAAGRSGSVCA